MKEPSESGSKSSRHGGLEIEVKLETYRSSSWRLKDRDCAARESGIVGSVARTCQIRQ